MTKTVNFVKKFTVFGRLVREPTGFSNKSNTRGALKMKNSGFVRFVVLMIVVCVSCGCATFNGYDDSEEIINQNRGYEYFGNGRSSAGTTYVYTAHRFTGVKEIATLEKKSFLALYVSSNFISGRCKLVLIKDSEIVMVCEGANDGIIDLSEIDDGNYMLKMVGEDVKNLTMRIICDQFNFPEYEESIE
jgi:hypothetical protein